MGKVKITKVDDLLTYKGDFNKLIADANFTMLQTLYADMMRRIFNKNKDTEGNTHQYKSESYKKYRKKHGKATNRKNWQFTDLLRNSIKTGRNLLGTEFAIGIIPSKYKDSATTTPEVSEYLEKQNNGLIFVPSDKEIKAAEAKTIKMIEEKIIKVLAL